MRDNEIYKKIPNVCANTLWKEYFHIYFDGVASLNQEKMVQGQLLILAYLACLCDLKIINQNEAEVIYTDITTQKFYRGEDDI